MSDKSIYKVELWDSNKIPYAYLEFNYGMNCGSLGNSCMRHRDMQRALQFYIKNKVKILVVTDNKSKIYARALYWENVELSDNRTKKPVTYVDRIYYANSEHYTMMKEYIKANKIKYAYDLDNRSKVYSYALTVCQGIYYFPYTDTFKYVDLKNKVLYRQTPREYQGSKDTNIIELSYTQHRGYRRELDKNSVQESFTGNYCSKKDCVYVKRYDGYVDTTNIFDDNGTYYSVHDRKHVLLDKSSKEYFHVRDAIIEKFTGHQINKKYATHSKIYDDYVSNANIVMWGDKVYSKHDPDIVKVDDEHYHKAQCYFIQFLNKWELKDKICIAYSLKQKEFSTDVEFDKEYIVPESLDKKYYFYLSSGEMILDGIVINDKSIDSRSLCAKYNKKFYLPQALPDVRYDKSQLLLFKV